MVDALMYEYTSGSPSLLTSVTETEEAEKGFKGTTALYSYDGTGNMIYASNKALSTTYSYHDMPVQLNTPNGKVQNYYTASGMKIKSVLLPNNMTLSDGPTITNYFDNIEYENSEVKAVYFDEGRAVTSKEGDYIEYFLKDHLGNTRVRISDKDQNNKVYYNVNDPANDEVMSSHHYYPFGMEWDMPSFDVNGNSLASAGEDTKYTYNGKEFQDDLGIDLHYYGFRVYDPAIGRFTSVDPYSDTFNETSPYMYAGNNPIKFIDHNGTFKIDPLILERYPKFAQYIKNRINEVLSNPRIVAGLKRFGHFTDAQLAEELQWENGPTIRFGVSDPNRQAGEFKRELDPNSLYINEGILNNIQNGSPELSAGALFQAGVTILHEYVHFGDFNYNDDNNPPEIGEEGHAFEEFVYGQKIFGPKMAGDFLNNWELRKQNTPRPTITIKPLPTKKPKPRPKFITA